VSNSANQRRRVTWRGFLLASLTLYLAVELLHDLSLLNTNLTGLYRISSLLLDALAPVLPNQASLLVADWMARYASRFQWGKLEWFVIEATAFLALSLPLSFFLGRQFARIEERIGLGVAALTFAAVSALTYILAVFVLFRV
jgi:hypothetical protein